MKALFSFVIGFVSDIINIMFAGTAFMLIWSWLVAPTFDVMALSWAMSIIIVFVVGYLHKPSDNDTDYANMHPSDVFDIVVRNVGMTFGRSVAWVFLAWMLMLIL